MSKRAKLLPTGEARDVVIPLRLNKDEDGLLEAISKSQGLAKSTYIKLVALNQACIDAREVLNKNFQEIADHIEEKLKTKM